ncbi:hypothetical protein FGO68_gene473 [Halteria grandinella]|uniref:Uncharacterized protein n=1 Tax=Halteria grandinella TaxID=5974 RepID=A0A8J8T066_HALGN|nr:hypothetical protein FGO68_gene473 [Halteria grandinella]
MRQERTSPSEQEASFRARALQDLSRNLVNTIFPHFLGLSYSQNTSCVSDNKGQPTSSIPISLPPSIQQQLYTLSQDEDYTPHYYYNKSDYMCLSSRPLYPYIFDFSI